MNLKTLSLLLGLGCVAGTGVILVYIKRDSDIAKDQMKKPAEK